MSEQNKHLKRVSEDRKEPWGGALVDLLGGRAQNLLQQLPGRHAPATLAPRVLAELARRAQLVWYRRPWTEWPEPWRWVSTVLLGGLVATILTLLESGWETSKSSPSLTAVHEVPILLQAVESSGRAVLLGWHQLPQSWLLIGGCGITIVFAGTFGLGTAAWRLARSSTR